MRRREEIRDFNRDALVEDLVTESKSTKLPIDAARKIADLVANDVETWMNQRSIVTEKDYNRVVCEKIGKYNEDLAYIYLNRDKII